jgi:Tfp pilus assembly protein PilF
MTSASVKAKPAPPPQEKHSSRISPELFSLAGLMVATVVTFSSTFHFGWVYDDPPQIPQNPNLRWDRFGFLFTHQLWASTAAAQSRFYRPLLTVWFLSNKTIFGLNPHGFHVTTVLAHVVATGLAFFVARLLLKDAGAALFAAAIFGLHPLQVESVSWISAVNDPLAAVFCFASFLAYRKAAVVQLRSSFWWTLAGAFFLLALLTKEVSIVLVGIVLIDLLTRPKNTGEPVRRSPLLPLFCAYGLVALFWLILRSLVLGGAAVVSAQVPWATIVLSAPKIFLFDLYRVIVPAGLSPQYDFSLIDSPFTFQFVWITLVLIAFVLLTVWAAKRNYLVWVASAWLVLPIVPTLNLRWMNQDDFIHDRYTYISMLGVALLAGSAYAWIRSKWPQQQLIRPLAVALVFALAFASAIQSQYWASDVSLFSRAVSRAPDNEWAQLNYGSALTARGKYADAAPHFVRSYELQPGWRAADFAGFAYQHLGDLSQAEHWYTTALQQDASVGVVYFGLAQIRLQQHQPLQAIPYLKKALELEPTADGFHYELGNALEQTSQFADAVEEYKTELQLHPNQTGAQKALDRLRGAGTKQDR